jgi:Methylase of chemotaxis methyl-accepting proteins
MADNSQTSKSKHEQDLLMAFTFFFRDSHVLDLVVKHVVPYVNGFSKIKIWDAGCAMGPEPYTLAIYFAENMGKFSFRNVRIDATDVDESSHFGEIINEAVYPEDELKRIPEDIFAKYFNPADKAGYFRLVDDIKNSVRYQQHDLLSLKPVGEGYHLILCKNVLLHFKQEERIEVIKMYHKSLAPGGYFATEQTQKMPPELSHLFTQVVTDGQLFKKNEE